MSEFFLCLPPSGCSFWARSSSVTDFHQKCMDFVPLILLLPLCVLCEWVKSRGLTDGSGAGYTSTLASSPQKVYKQEQNIHSRRWNLLRWCWDCPLQGRGTTQSGGAEKHLLSVFRCSCPVQARPCRGEAPRGAACAPFSSSRSPGSPSCALPCQMWCAAVPCSPVPARGTEQALPPECLFSSLFSLIFSFIFHLWAKGVKHFMKKWDNILTQLFQTLLLK